MGVLQSIVPELNVTWLTFTDHKLARLGYIDSLLYVCSRISFIISLQLQRQEIKCWNAPLEDHLDFVCLHFMSLETH